jgi:predicted nuclease of predicted toxin-antitoxin system
VKLLLDECLPHELRHFLHMHQVFTATYMKWDGLKNGKLLAAAAADGFEAMITSDQSLQFQQNLRSLPIAVVVLRTQSNAIDDIRPLLPNLLVALTALEPRKVTAESMLRSPPTSI